jgi:hypothetical protein
MLRRADVVLRAVLLGATVLGALACRVAAGDWDVGLIEQPSELVGFPATTEFQQSQNPSYVPRSHLLPAGGLMVRVQNCSGKGWAGYGPVNHSSCNYGHGGGGGCQGDSGYVRDHIAFLPFPAGYTGAMPPLGLPKITPAQSARQTPTLPQPAAAAEPGRLGLRHMLTGGVVVVWSPSRVRAWGRTGR